MYISIDMGGTYTRIASTKDLTNLFRSVKFRTKATISDQRNALSYEIKRLLEGESLEAICLGVPGTLDIDNKKFIRLPNYSALDGKNFDSLLSDDLKAVDLLVVNDAHVAGYYEAIEGVGKDFNNLLYISIGTGIGGLYIKNKNINNVFENFEPGHDYIFSDGLDFEAHCSGHNFHKKYEVGVASYASDTIWKDYSKNMTEGLTYYKNKYAIDAIVLGGGFSINNFNSFIGYLPKELNVMLTESGDLGGILGGFCVLRKYFSN